MIKVKSCGIIIFSEEGKEREFLILKHKNGGHWSFPKGHKEKGETDEETAVREVKEETGLEMNRFIPFQQSIHYKTDREEKEVVYFLSKVKKEIVSLQQEEIAEHQWLPYEDALKQLTYPETKQLLREANKILTSLPSA